MSQSRYQKERDSSCGWSFPVPSWLSLTSQTSASGPSSVKSVRANGAP